MKAFDPTGDLDLPLHLRKRASLLFDMGPDCVCYAGIVLNYLRLRASLFCSIAHKGQRCLWLGVSHAGMFGDVLVGNVVANLERGPNEGETNHVKMNESTLDYQVKAGPNDALLKMNGPNIMLDRGKNPDDLCP